ncbi:hypothetical protein MSSIH_1737 [Methanosarcina siciliae HI350]|uniref:Uncharacterized protein n=1 Tax=Methanosarcina siciliae HI350 TaxID=1434119 RepID=A0A0E3PD92_9EURY|nr:hypothetical protein [Methanosarcina siciliae]AKB32427.1 hypothetical protein MSSIH_1737 [Methanosarcina siciliae HI350]
MDTEAFLHQLESAVTNNDKRLFAKTIYDLPADVIVGFTKEEFSRIIYISHHFSSQKTDRLSNFLEIKGLFFLKNALKGVDELNNFLLSKFYFSLFVSLSENDNEKVKRVLFNTVAACVNLAEMGIDITENLEITVRLCEVAKEMFHKTSTGYFTALISEGDARQKLSEIGVNSMENIEIAIQLYGGAQNLLLQKDTYYASILVSEGNSRQILADIGIDSKENLETAIYLYARAKEIFPETSIEYARILVNEGVVRQKLAEIGAGSRENLETAIRLYDDAKRLLSKTSDYYATALLNEGNTRQIIADVGINSKGNLETAIHLYGIVREILPKRSLDYTRALMSEGKARQALAEMGIDIQKNLEIALHFYTQSKEMFPKKSLSYAHLLVDKGNVLQILARVGIESKENLETAVNLYSEAKKIFYKTSVDYALTLMNEGSARLRLAEMGADSQNYLETAVCLYMDAQEIFSKTSVYYAGSLMNEGYARQILAGINIDYSNNNFERSKKLYLDSISILDKLEDGWTYSTALFNMYSLLKNNFYKTGNKKYLEEWEKNLGDIEEKIKDRNIRYKELLMARIHEILASLLEFEGKSGINKASREYEKAYKLSKDPFYNFMDEFCQARIDTISFCELVSNWKLEEKKDIFLDYYDYTVFECHLENALKSTINEEEELKLAVEKLKEIRDRTQIKIIKDRVSAYICLLQALVDCFTEEAYTEAAKNVKEGCKIFREYGDKQGQQMCEIFHNAIVKKREPDAWQEIIRNRDFSSNFYSLLCEYSDRKRIDLEYYKYGQINERMQTVSEDVKQVKEISIRTKNKIDEIQSQLHSGFAEIKDQVGKGFKGTDAELKKINEKIDNIQHDLDNLVQISNDVGGKEGKCIRKFASQMLELMKKGDYEALKRFSEKIAQNSSSIEEIIESAEIPEKEKVEAKSKLADLKKIPGILKGKTKYFSVGVTENVIANLIYDEIVDDESIKIVSLVSGEIIKLLIPVLSTAAFGVPIPSRFVEMLLEAMKSS